MNTCKLTDMCCIQYGYAFDSASFTEDATFPPLVRIRDVKEVSLRRIILATMQKNILSGVVIFSLGWMVSLTLPAGKVKMLY